VGAGASQQKKFIDEGTGDENNGTFTLGADFNWNISETATFEQILSSMTTSDNTSWESITRLKVNAVNNIALTVGYTIQGNTDVDAGRDRTDRYTAITLDCT
jgi:putative salt-induced outer membrane protein